MKMIYDDHNAEGIVLIDAVNAINGMARKVTLHNGSIICPMLATYLIITHIIVTFATTGDISILSVGLLRIMNYCHHFQSHFLPKAESLGTIKRQCYL